MGMERLFGLLLEEGDQVVAVLVLLETTEGHLGTGNVLLGVLEVLELNCVSSVPIAVSHSIIPECSRPSECPSACWRRCMSSPRLDQSCGRRDRAAQGQSCCPRQPSECGTVRIGSTVCQWYVGDHRSDGDGCVECTR
jgi:hypothetical protein